MESRGEFFYLSERGLNSMIKSVLSPESDSPKTLLQGHAVLLYEAEVGTCFFFLILLSLFALFNLEDSSRLPLLRYFMKKNKGLLAF